MLHSIRRFLRIVPGIFLVGVIAESARAQESVAWIQAITGQPSFANPVVDAEGNVYVTWTDSLQNNHLRKVSPQCGLVFDKQLPFSGIVNTVAISPQVQSQSQRILLKIYLPSLPSTFEAAEVDCNGNALWQSPVIVPEADDLLSQSVTSEGAVTLYCSSSAGYFFFDISATGTASRTVSLGLGMGDAFPLPTGNWLLNFQTTNASCWGVFNPETGQELFGGSNPATNTPRWYIVTAAKDGTMAVLWIDSATESLRTFDTSGKLLGSYTNYVPTTNFNITSLAFDLQDNLYANGIGSPQAIECFTRTLQPKWKRAIPWSMLNPQHFVMSGDATGVFYIYGSYTADVQPIYSNTIVYHINAGSQVDFSQNLALPDVFPALTVAGAAEYMFYNNGNVRQAPMNYLERMVFGPSLTSLVATPVTGPNQQTTLTINLNAPAPAGGLQVNLSASDPAVAFSSNSVTVPAGQQSVTTTAMVGTLTHNPARITAKAANGAIRNASIGY